MQSPNFQIRLKWNWNFTSQKAKEKHTFSAFSQVTMHLRIHCFFLDLNKKLNTSQSSSEKNAIILIKNKKF